MPPPKTKASLEELVLSLSEKIDAMAEQHKERFDKIDSSLKELKEDHIKTKARVATLEQENVKLKTKIHDLELHSRSTTVRIINLQLTEDLTQDFVILSEVIYQEVFLPILRGAMDKGRLRDIPSREQLITMAHLLPGKEGKPKPVYCRLINNFYRTLILQHQREFGRRQTGRPSRAGADLHLDTI